MVCAAKPTTFRVLLVVLAVITIGPILGPAQHVSAEATTPGLSNGITISPTLKELVLSSGLVEARNAITITNRSGRDLSAVVKVVDFSSLNQSGGVAFGQAGTAASKYPLANWMILPLGKNVSLPNGQATQIPVNVQNRSDLAPGGHYGAVVVTTSTAGTATNNLVGFKQELVSLLFVKKLGGEQYGLNLDNLQADETRHIPSSVSLKFASTGNVHVVPRGYVTVSDGRGKVVAKGIINPESSLVLPGSSRQFVTLMQPVAESNIPGRYAVTAYYRYDGLDQFLSKSIYISSWPAAIVLASVAGLLLAAAAVFLLVRTRRNRH